MDVVNQEADVSLLLQEKLSSLAYEEFGTVLDDVLEQLDKNAVTLTQKELSKATFNFNNYLYHIGSSLEYDSHAKRFSDASKHHFSSVDFDSVGIAMYRHDKGYSTPHETSRLASTYWASARNQVGSLLQEKTNIASVTQEIFDSPDKLFAFFALQVDARVLSEEAVRRSYVLLRREREKRVGVFQIKSLFDWQEFKQLESKYLTIPKTGFASEQELYNIMSNSKKLFLE